MMDAESWSRVIFNAPDALLVVLGLLLAGGQQSLTCTANFSDVENTTPSRAHFQDVIQM